jgi:hypothetical protein
LFENPGDESETDLSPFLTLIRISYSGASASADNNACCSSLFLGLMH